MRFDNPASSWRSPNVKGAFATGGRSGASHHHRWGLLVANGLPINPTAICLPDSYLMASDDEVPLRVPIGYGRRLTMVTMMRGRAADAAMQFEQMNPGAALTISQIVGHNTVRTAPRAERWTSTTAAESSPTVPTAIHIGAVGHQVRGARSHRQREELETISAQIVGPVPWFLPFLASCESAGTSVLKPPIKTGWPSRWAKNTLSTPANFRSRWSATRRGSSSG